MACCAWWWVVWQYLEFAPPGVSVAKVKELALKHKGNRAAIEEEIQKLWEGERRGGGCVVSMGSV